MRTKQIKKLLCLLCVCLPVVLGAVAAARNETPSILDRIQKEDDSELAELIRMALEKRENISREATLELIRKITQSYVQIKLLDLQVAEVSRKIESQNGPAEMRYELLLAKAELESKRATEMANLRDMMGIVPRLPFDKKQIVNLNTWLHLHVLDQGVHVLDSVGPYAKCWESLVFWQLKSSGLMSRRETLDVVRERLQNKTNLPIRIDLHHTTAMRSSAEDLRNRIISLLKEANCQMDAEINLKPCLQVRKRESTFFIREGTISTFYAGRQKLTRPDGGYIFTGEVEPNDLDQHILWRLTSPGLIPLKYRIEYDQTSARLAMQTADRISAIAKDLGISELVDVERILVESVPKTAFLGRWQTTTRGDVQTIDIRPKGECIFVKSRESASGKGGTSVPGRWFLTPKEIFMDIKDKQPDSYYVYLGHFDKQGNLVVRKGVVYRHGTFLSDTINRMVFKKMY